MPEEQTESGPVAPPSVLALQEDLLRYLTNSTSSSTPSSVSGKETSIATAVYRHAGPAAQPAEHPLIDVAASGAWLVVALLLVLGETRTQLEGVDAEVEQWVAKWDGHGVAAKQKVRVEWRTWGGELFMR